MLATDDQGPIRESAGYLAHNLAVAKPLTGEHARHPDGARVGGNALDYLRGVQSRHAQRQVLERMGVPNPLAHGVHHGHRIARLLEHPGQIRHAYRR